MDLDQSKPFSTVAPAPPPQRPGVVAEHKNGAQRSPLNSCVNICARRWPAGGGKAGPGRRLRLLHGEAVSDGPELHAAAHPRPALHL